MDYSYVCLFFSLSFLTFSSRHPVCSTNSLLLGVDSHQKTIVCGLVDTIGSYTFAKTLEYKAKQGLQSGIAGMGAGKEVTVMPPGEYQERFVGALEGYFVACPDKWSKPVDESKVLSDPDLIPGVL
ncbi:hypothetical protein CVT26_013260 [Gymnopilus dilepis]|uniref:PIPK domain-containing protein n=1 Tax=Gymnopilus dilepis TaxID=231916 RepID=A0A409VUK1_9AGAR|nr:hypothetical protein CVT26_013260 [Gymnopilus dilepis]